MKLQTICSTLSLLWVCACHPPGLIGEEGVGDGPVTEGKVGDGVSVSPYITDGQIDNGHPSVGEVAWSNSAGCTGTLVGRRTVVTAAHCIKSGPMYFRVGGASHAASRAVRHPQYHDGNLNNDIAVLVLRNDVQNVQPTPIATGAPQMGQTIILVGFGRTSGSSYDYGTKRMGTNKISKLTPTTFYYHGTGNGVAGTCNGDSGGPAFVMKSGKELLAGVTSWGDKYCQQFGVDTRVDSYRQWIVQQGGKDVLLEGAGGGGGGGGGGSAPPPAGGAKAQEGQSCASRACAGALQCTSVYSGAKHLGRFCMERCQTLGNDAACDGGEVCTQYQPNIRICFHAQKPNTGYTNNSGGGSGGSAPPPAVKCGSAEETEALRLLNKERLGRGIAALGCAPAGLNAARGHSQDMCKRGYFSHTSPDGKGVTQRLQTAGAKFSSAGENIARGFWKGGGVHQRWMKSPNHRDNMLNPAWSRIGIGQIVCKGANPIWTQVLLK